MKYHLLPTEQRALMKSTRTKLRTPASLPKVRPLFLQCTYFFKLHFKRFHESMTAAWGIPVKIFVPELFITKM